MTTRQRLNGSTTSSPASSSFTNTTATRDPEPQRPPARKSKDEAIKARIIRHMNSDHADSLSLYLRHYCDLSPAAVESPKLVDMTYYSLIVESNNNGGSGSSSVRRYSIPVVPPMDGWGDVRPRVVAMDREARAGLGLPPLPPSSSADEHSSSSLPTTSSSSSSPSSSKPPAVILRAYDPPTSPFHLFVIGLVIWFYAGYFALRQNNGTTTGTGGAGAGAGTAALRPGTWYWDHVMAWFPVGGAEGYRRLNLALGVPVAVVHGAEALVMAWRLRAYGVRGPWGPGMGLWWRWVASTVLEGGGAHQRLSAVVRRGGGGKVGEGEKGKRGT